METGEIIIQGGEVITIDMNKDIITNNTSNSTYGVFLTKNQLKGLLNKVQNTLKHYDENRLTDADILFSNQQAVESWYNKINEISRKIEKENKTKGNYKTYLMTDSNTGYTKIGKSTKPRKREKTLQSEKPTITLFAVCDDDIESKLQMIYESLHIRGEWYNLTESHIDDIFYKYNFKIV